jgi:hypothetical protein
LENRLDFVPDKEEEEEEIHPAPEPLLPFVRAGGLGRFGIWEF